jgi:hypothetical protein
MIKSNRNIFTLQQDFQEQIILILEDWVLLNVLGQTLANHFHPKLLLKGVHKLWQGFNKYLLVGMSFFCWNGIHGNGRNCVSIYLHLQ